jgi:5-methylcytosine-specific restriction endonuclease McrA
MSTSIPHDSDLDFFGHLLDYAQTEECQPQATGPTIEQKRLRNRTYSKNYRERYPEAVKMRAQAAKHKARLYERQNGLCYLCGNPLGERYEVDHKVALTNGGTNALRNLCVVHRTCNLKKGAR